MPFPNEENLGINFSSALMENNYSWSTATHKWEMHLFVLRKIWSLKFLTAQKLYNLSYSSMEQQPTVPTAPGTTIPASFLSKRCLLLCALQEQANQARWKSPLLCSKQTRQNAMFKPSRLKVFLLYLDSPKWFLM